MMHAVRQLALVVGSAAMITLQACTSLSEHQKEDDEGDEAAIAALQCMSMFQGAEYQNLVAQFEAQERETLEQPQSAAVTDQGDDERNPPKLFLGEETSSCYLDESNCRAEGNRLCKIVAEGRIFGLPIDQGAGGVIDPSSAALATAGVAAAAAVAVGVAVSVAGGSSSTVNTTD